MTIPRSDALVIFGATGDLAFKKIFPALQALVQRGRLDMPVVGVGRSQWTLEQFKARAKESIEKHDAIDPAAFAKLASLLNYVDGDYLDPATFANLRTALGTAQRPLYYLVIPPSAFGTVIAGLVKSGCNENARIVVEKPFGRDLASAQELNRTLHAHFSEQAIFRIDHYLGKEPVQNLIYFRFANPLLEAGWNNKYIESVQVTMAENFGAAGRGKFYEEAGAIRDIMQNHMLQVIACLAEDAPTGNDREARRDQRARVLQAVRTLTPADVVRGQYRGYRNETGVAADSRVETFAAIRFHIDNERWAGVLGFPASDHALHRVPRQPQILGDASQRRSSSFGRRPTLLSPKIAALAERSSISTTRTLNVRHATWAAAVRRLKPSSNSARPSRQQAVSGDNWPYCCNDRAIASSAAGSASR